MIAHIKRCKFISSDDRTHLLLTYKPLAAPKSPVNAVSLSPSQSLSVPAAVAPAITQGNSRPVNRSQSLRGVAQGGVKLLASTLSASQLQEEFSADLCKLLIALNTAWVAADNPSLHRFIHKWVGSEVVVQDRRILSGRVLDQEVRRVEDVVVGKVHGKVATGQCDGWKNVAKSSVVSTMMSVENEVSLVTSKAN